MIRVCVLILVSTLFSTTVTAQEIVYNKKNNFFSYENHEIALLKKEKATQASGSNYYLTQPGGEHLIAWKLQHFEDILGGNSTFYYITEVPSKSWQAYRPNFTSLNTEKEIAQSIISDNLLSADGQLNESSVQKLFQQQLEQYGNIQQQLQHANDSLSQLLLPFTPPVERNFRKGIVATQYGRIGQGDVEIGSWELITTPKNNIGNSNKYAFIIRNSGGGIVCISHIELSGARTYFFSQGVRSAAQRKVLNLVDANPLSDQAAQYKYVVELAQQSVSKKLL